MDRNGITIYFFIYDDAIKVGEQIGWHLDAAGELHPGEKQFLQEIVNKFEHHKNLVWCIMEEGQEIGKDWQLHISKIAETIREADDYDHVIANHQLGGNVFFHANDPNIDQFAIQGNWETGSTPDSIHNWLVETWELAEGRYNLNMAEFKTHDDLSLQGDREGIRKNSWAMAMAGSYIMVLGMEIINTPPGQLQDCRHLQQFFESTNINDMAPHDELRYGGTEYVLASPGFSYIAYSSENSKNIGLRNLEPGTYDLTWFDCLSGQRLERKNTGISSGSQSWEKPRELGEEVALYIRRSDGKVSPATFLPQKEDPKVTGEKKLKGQDENIIPLAPDKNITTNKDTPVEIQLTYYDPDGGPGPYTTTILIHPSYGKLTGVGNDQTYSPVPGYTGTDTITWKVNDGADDSKTATIQIIINP
jgi:hypothetical protein